MKQLRQESHPGDNAFCSDSKAQVLLSCLPAPLPPSAAHLHGQERRVTHWRRSGLCGKSSSAWPERAKLNTSKAPPTTPIPQLVTRREPTPSLSTSTLKRHGCKKQPQSLKLSCASQLLWGLLCFGLLHSNFMVCPIHFFPNC